MLEQATITESTSLAFLPACAKASLQAITAISHCTEGSSLLRSGMYGAMRLGSRMPVLSITWRRLIPEAFSINDEDEGCKASVSPRAMASAWSELYISTNWLKASTSSSLSMVAGGVYRPVPLMTAFITLTPRHECENRKTGISYFQKY